MLIITGVDDGCLPTDYKSVGDGIVYYQAWDETAELLISDEAWKRMVEMSGINRGKIKSREVGKGKVQRSEVGESEVGESEVGESEVEGIEVEKSKVENWEMEDSDVGESETGENDTEKSDHFEDCN